ncbi:MAG: PQQ-dependent sugar dehydrogenase [Nitrososphaeraceae archaeon]
MDKKYLRKIILPIIAVIVLSIVTILRSPSETTIPLPLPNPISSTKVNDTKGIAIMADKLQTPWSIAFSENGTGFFTERSGTIKEINANGKMLKDPLAYIRVDQIGEGGLLGIALHPNFTSNHKMYVYHTYSNNSGTFNKVLMLLEKQDKIIDSETIFDGIPGGTFHNGGRLKFGPDSKLYVSTGDASKPELAQDKNSLAGKILRINDDGSIPQDNPFPGSPVYAFGFRNVQGMTWNPETKVMYATEHGSTGNDEIDIVRPGSNYGWPNEECSEGKAGTAPIICFNPSIAPSGITFVKSNKLGYKDDLIVATLKGSHLRSINLKTGEQNNILVGYGRLRDVVEGPNGFLYVLTSNTDGRGIPQETDDKILRIFKP